MSLMEILAALANTATILGVPIFLISYLSNQAAERKRAEYGTYDALDEKYVEFQKLAIQYPKLDIADAPMPASDVQLSAEEIAVRRTLYQILIATFERAFLMYKDKSDQMRLRQWQGWDQYLESYCDRPAFVDAFFNGTKPSAEYSPTFDRDFEAYMKKKFSARGII
ncbi:MAG: hypothetical protein ABL883_05505 [Terricaulis sp.]